MPQPESAQEFYRRIQRLQLVVIAAGRKAWAGMRQDFDASWAEVSPGLVQVTAAGQLAAARAATEYVPAVLEETNQPDRPDAAVRPRAFAGVAADGRSLPGLLESAKVHAKQSQSLEVGGRRLDALLQSIITDAARGATQAEVVTRQGMGFVRALNPPSCKKCAILAGRWYRFNAGFSRHPPTCDCYAIPAAENVAGDLTTSPQKLYEQGMIRDLTKREIERIDAGEDLNKVVNASRDMWRARLSEQRIAEKANAKTSRQGLEDLFASTKDRIDAVNKMRDAGFVD